MTTPSSHSEPRAVSVGEHAGGHSATSSANSALSSEKEALRSPQIGDSGVFPDPLHADGSAVRAGDRSPHQASVASRAAEGSATVRDSAQVQPARTTERMQALDRVLYRVLYTMTAEFIERAFDGYHGEERDEPDAYHREVDTL